MLGLGDSTRAQSNDEAGFPTAEISVPGIKDLNAYALEISGDSMQPVYRRGDIVIVSPNATVRPEA